MMIDYERNEPPRWVSLLFGLGFAILYGGLFALTYGRREGAIAGAGVMIGWLMK